MGGVNFDGQFLIKPQAAARIDDTALNNDNVDNSIIVAIVGQAEGGEPNLIRRFTDITSVRRAHRKGDIVEACKKCFAPSADSPGVFELFTIRANAATQSILDLNSGVAASAGQADGTAAAPWNLDAGQTLVVDVDAGGDATATFLATSGLKAGAAGTFAASAAETLDISIDGGPTQTITFGAGTETTAELYAQVINAQLLGAAAIINAGEIDIKSDSEGTASSVNIIAGSGTILAKIGQALGLVAGTGNVADINAVTFAEAKTVIEAAIAGLTVNQLAGLELSLVSNTLGVASSIQVNVTSTATVFGFDNVLHSGSAAAPAVTINLTSVDFGLHTTGIKLEIEDGTLTGKKLTLEKDGSVNREDNVERNSFTVQYIGAGSAAVMDIGATSLTTTVTGAPSENLNLLFSNFPTLQELCDFIDTDANYTCIVSDTLPTRASSELDDVAAQDIKTAVFQAKSDFQAVIDALNSGGFGDIIEAVQAGAAKVVPTNIPPTFFAGGIEGALTNTEWSEALLLLETVDIKILCLLTSIASVHAMGDTHVQTMSGIINKKRRVQFAGGALGERTITLDNYLDRAFNLNSNRTALVPFGLKDFNDDGDLVDLDPFLVAAQFAGLQAGLGIPNAVTNRFISTQGIEFTNDLTIAEQRALLQGGLLFPEVVPGVGIRVVQGLTTELGSTKFTDTEISVRLNADEIAESVEQALGLEFVGRVSDIFFLPAVVSRTQSILNNLQRDGLIVGDTENPGFRNITATLNGDVVEVSFEASIGIPANYILIAAHLVPFQGTLTA